MDDGVGTRRTEPSTATDAETAEESAQSRQVKRSARAGRSRRARRNRLLQAGVLVGILALWWLITAIELVDPLYLPSPQAVAGAFLDANRCLVVDDATGRTVCGVQNYYLWEHLIASLQRIGVGVSLAAVAGIALGFLMSMWEPANTALAPYLNFLRALPPLGYIGLIIVWVGIGDTSKYLLLFLAAFPPIVIATIDGVRGVRSDYLAAARSMGAGPGQVARFVVLPAATASIFSGVRLAIGFAWTTVVAAELNNGIPGIGGLAYISGTQLNTALTIACIIVIGLVAVTLDAIIRWIGDRLVPWHGKV
ncbi:MULTISPECIES: ABC transporter permease [Brachybacterium]|uniref:ABC transporter permease n=2 Tax=Brachybacterium TaxID=43668 RepID=A0A426SJU6_9MICO|nr:MULTISPECIES: ABC transporter permease [Brachybacterium]RRR18447.1 ABC transporter permease [Brachybacterium paraconglomeratum]GLI30089.1 taurine ABC transporter permease [Brachybacterium conglomeratum]GLK04627.1 taurine ABC transporter permease [Brachybacterium conglomeratum]